MRREWCVLAGVALLAVSVQAQPRQGPPRGGPERGPEAEMRQAKEEIGKLKSQMERMEGQFRRIEEQLKKLVEARPTAEPKPTPDGKQRFQFSFDAPGGKGGEKKGEGDRKPDPSQKPDGDKKAEAAKKPEGDKKAEAKKPDSPRAGYSVGPAMGPPWGHRGPGPHGGAMGGPWGWGMRPWMMRSFSFGPPMTPGVWGMGWMMSPWGMKPPAGGDWGPPKGPPAGPPPPPAGPKVEGPKGFVPPGLARRAEAMGHAEALKRIDDAIRQLEALKKSLSPR